MKAVKTFTIILTSLAAIASAYPASTENADPLIFPEKNTNILSFRELEEYKILLVGKRLPGDKFLTSGGRVRPMKEADNTLEIKLSSEYKPSFIKFNYTSVDQKITNSSLRFLEGGPGWSYFKVEYSTDSTAIFIQWEVYGFIEYGSVADTSIQSAQDLEVRLRDAKDKLVVLLFSAQWCDHSEKVELEQVFDDSDVVFVKIDVDKVVGAREKYSVDAYPTFVFIKNNNEVGDRVVGALSAEEKVEKIVEQYC